MTSKAPQARRVGVTSAAKAAALQGEDTRREALEYGGILIASLIPCPFPSMRAIHLLVPLYTASTLLVVHSDANPTKWPKPSPITANGRSRVLITRAGPSRPLYASPYTKPLNVVCMHAYFQRISTATHSRHRIHKRAHSPNRIALIRAQQLHSFLFRDFEFRYLHHLISLYPLHPNFPPFPRTHTYQ
jgi:hypothetical protein